MKFLQKIKKVFSNYKTPILYSGSSFVKSGVQIITGFIIARLIAPSDLGIWNSISLAITYSVFLQAGLINGLNIELPLSLGKGENNRANNIAGTVLTITAITMLLSFIIGISYFFFGNINDSKMRYGILAVTFLIPISLYQSYLTSTFRSNSSFLNLAKLQIVEALLNLVTVVLVVRYAYYGMVGKVVLVGFISITILHFLRPFKISFSWNKKELILILKVGFPIFGLVYLDTISSTFDRLLLLKFGNVKSVGLYSFAMYSMSLFTIFSTSVASYIYPRMTYNYAQNNDKAVLWQYVKKITGVLLALQTPLVCIFIFIIPYAISNFFPLYIESTRAMQILLAAGLFKGSVVGVNVLWSIKAWKYMIFYQVLYSLFLVLFIYLGVTCYSNPLNGAALGVLFANALNLISGIILSKRATSS
jgi:O-antigen/teichoic acid export membrane protein